MPADLALLVDPGRGRAAVAAVRLVQRLRARGARVRVLAGRSGADSARLALRAAAERPDALVAVGGDGLVHQALQGVVGTGVALAIVPAGTGNDIARALGCPAGRPDRTAAALLAGRTRPVDAVRLTLADGTERHYLSVLACGFDARVNERVNGFRFSAGRADYLRGLVAELGSFAAADYSLDVDGTRIDEPGLLVAVGNTAAYGGGIPMCPGAIPDDGLLDVVLLRAAPLAHYLPLLPRILTGHHTTDATVVALRGRRVAIRAGAGAAYADGERMGPGPLVCEAVPKSVEVLDTTS